VPVPKKIVRFLIDIYNIFIVNKLPTQTCEPRHGKCGQKLAAFFVSGFSTFSIIPDMKNTANSAIFFVFWLPSPPLSPPFHPPSTQIRSTWLIWPHFSCLGFNIPNMKGVAIFGHTFHVSSSSSLPSPPRHEMRPFLASFFVF